MQKRYAQLIELVEQVKPETIVEIGVWNGVRAMEMATAALKYHPEVHYTGYDLFEEATAETDEFEFNKKAHNTIEVVRSRLVAFASKNPGFTFDLVKGNTRETLATITVDFVYIDGGHSVDTIYSDYLGVEDSKVIVFDDYYSPDASGACPDLEKVGANKTVEFLGTYARVLESTDVVTGGGIVHLAIAGPQTYKDNQEASRESEV